MPAQSRTRTWWGPTSPRSPYKLPNEIALLAEHFDGRLWNPQTQAEYISRLAQSAFYEGEGPRQNPDFAGRDRVNRAPRMLGFVRLGRGRPLQVLPAEHRLIQSRNASTPDFDVFLHQLLKWQYPSPMHSKRDYSDLSCIKPFLECLRLLRHLGHLTKPELAIFCIPYIDYRVFERVRVAVEEFRRGLATHTGRRARGEYVADIFRSRMAEVYRDDIMAGRTGTREEGGTPQSLDAFLAKKERNVRDYADAALRYLRASGLFYVQASPFKYRLRLLEERVPEVDQILTRMSPVPEPFVGREDAYYEYLGDPDLPRLADEEPALLRRRISTLYEAVSPRTQDAIRPHVVATLALTEVHDLKSAYHRINHAAEEAVIEQIQEDLALNHETVQEIEDLFDEIVRGNVPDRPMYFEWNIWRALSYIDLGEVKPNFTMDRTGQPILISSGVPDMECHYDSFHLMVDVTMAYGHTQANMEGEPVPRHVGLFQQGLRQAGDTRPVYGLFVAPKLSDTVVAMFYAWHRISTKAFGPAVSVVPMDLQTFRQFISAAREAGTWTVPQLHRFFNSEQKAALREPDEEQWLTYVRLLVRTWPSVSNAAPGP